MMFEHIHPFQDGNGKVDRFIMLKECMKNNIALILIEDIYSKRYNDALFEVQSQNNYVGLLKVFSTCQELLDTKLSFLKNTIDYMSEHGIELKG